MARRRIILLWLLFWPAMTYGQQVPGLTHLTSKDGLSQGYIRAILQDRDGFIWVGTLHGLNRYDGYTFTSWYADPQDPDALPTESITALAEDSRGRLWVGTKEGVRIFDRRTNTFHRLRGANGHLLPAADQEANSLKALPNGKVMQVVNGEKTIIYEPQRGNNLTYAAREDTTPAPVNEAEGYLRRRGIPLASPGLEPLEILGAETGTPFFRYGNELYQLAVRRPPGAAFPTPAERIFESPYPLRSWYLDRGGILWLGTNARGLLRYDPANHKFRSHAEGYSVYLPVGLDQTRVTLGDLTREVLINCRTRQPEPAPWAGSYPAFFPIGKDRLGRLLLFSYTSPQFSLHRLPLAPTIPAAVAPIYSCIAEGAAGEIFLVYNEQNILRYTDQDSIPRLFQFGDGSARAGVRPPLSPIVRDAAGRLWIGTRSGLVLATPRPGGEYTFQYYRGDQPGGNAINNESVLSLSLDALRPHTLWVGTKGGGLNKFNTQTGRWQAYTMADGLPDNVIYGILPDPAGDLWLSTNRGLCRFDPDRLTFDYYTAEDGLQNDEFNTRAYSRNEWGELLFGGVNGITRFFPADIGEDTIPPPTYLTEIRINDHVLQPGDSTGLLTNSVIYTEKLRLNHRQNTLTFQFAALDYSIPAKNRYRYRLIGAHSAWREAGTQRTVNYTNLPPGRYTFEVLGSNSDGVWSVRPARLAIHIRPPWWWSPPTQILYVLLLLLAGLGVYRREYRRLHLKHQLALRQQESENLKQLDLFKSSLYTNITHEFRTPLTVILGMTRDLLRRPEHQPAKLALIHRNGNHLLTLVNQLLDLARAEANQLGVDWVQGDVVAYLRYLTESFQTLAQQRKISLQLVVSAPVLVMDYDAEKLRQILTNLLGNALKYTPTGGHVEVRLDADAEQRVFVLTVANSGPGVPADEMPYVFDRFFQGSAGRRQGSTGIGLALTRQLVHLLRGQISVRSEAGAGAVFQVRLPVNREAPAAGPLPRVFPDTDVPATDSAPATPDGKLPTLLLVEDNPDVTLYISTVLQPYYRLHFAADGRAGIDLALSLVPDLILSDVMMPEADGLTLCDTLKNDVRTSHIPIILLTAKADVSSRIAGLRHGADDYLAKPFHEEELRVRLERLLWLRRKLRDKYRQLGLGETVAAAEVGAAGALPDDTDTAFMRALNDFLAVRYTEPGLKLEDICQALAMGRTNLHQKLLALTGLSAMQLLRRYRLRHAEKLLLQSKKNIAEITYASGFDDPRYFSRVFAKEYGQSPGAYRRAGGEGTRGTGDKGTRDLGTKQA